MHPFPWRAFPRSDASDCSLGPVDQSTVAKVKVEITDEEKARLKRVETRPLLSEILNLHDFEVDSTRSFGKLTIQLISPRHKIGHRSAGDAGESVGLLLFRRGRRNNE